MIRTALLHGFLLLVWIGELCVGQNPRIVSESRDSAGIEIVFSDLSDEGMWPSCGLAAEPAVRIGVQHGDPNAELYQVEDAHLLSDGRIVAVNRGSRDLRVFDSTGVFLYSVGRNGEGPGEFRDPIEVSVLPPDSLVVWDWALGRLSVFTHDGEFVRSVRPQPPVVNPTGYFEVLPSDHPFIFASHDARHPTGSRFVDQYLQLPMYDRAGNSVGTPVTLPYGSKARLDPTQPNLWTGRLFESRGSFTVSGDLLLTANGLDPEVQVWLPGRNLQRIIRWLTPDRKIRSGDADAYRARLSFAARTSLYRIPTAETFPAVLQVKADATGHVLVRRYPRPTQDNESWLRFDERGAFLCELAIPRQLTVMHFDDVHVLVKNEDDLGTEYLELYSVERVGR